MNKYSFQIIPPHSGKIRQLRIGGSRLKWLLSGAGAFILINLAVLVWSLTSISNVNENRKLIETNRALTERLEAMSNETDSLALLLERFHAIGSKISDIADLPEIDQAELSYGIGGPELAYLDPDQPIVLARARDVDRKLDSLLVAARAENKALLDARDLFNKKTSVLSRTPSTWPVHGYVSSGFGKRKDPFTGTWKMHEGIDICARKGTPVRATADGRVRFAGWYHDYGKTVRINHIYYETRYAHLDDIKVRQGQSVKRGDIIGTCGNSGRATGVHLHYEVRVSGKPVDPKGYITPQVVVD